MQDEMIELGPLAVAECRRARRFNMIVPLDARFGNAAITIVNLGAGGMLVEHSQSLRLGMEGEVFIETPEDVPPLPVRVVWSRLSKSRDAEGRLRYRTGLKLTSDSASAIGAVGRLLRGRATPETGALDRKRESLERKARSIAGLTELSSAPKELKLTADQLLLIRETRDYFHAHPDAAAKWYNRAKFASSDSSSAIAHHRSEVLAIWECLGRKVAIELIAIALEAIRLATSSTS